MITKPNILVLITDQQRFDTIQQDHMCQTPHIQALKEKGVNFTKAYTPNAICSPARASLMTGLYPSRHGMVDCTHNVEPYRAELKQGVRMWSQILQEHDYKGGYFGKWHVERSDQLEQFGFEEYVHDSSKEFKEYRESMGCGERKYSESFVLKSKGYKDRILYGIYDESAEMSEPYFLYSKGIEFIRKQSKENNPWFTVISTLEPHDPFIAPESYVMKYDPKQISIPESYKDILNHKPNILKRLRTVWDELTELDIKKSMACYYALCSMIDDQVGRVIEMLQETGQLENTVIIYTTDHGELLGAHGLFFKGVPAYEEVYHIPLVISGYGVQSKGRNCDAHVNLVDLATTIIELSAGKALDESKVLSDTDGHSMVPLLEDTTIDSRQSPWNETYAEFHGQRFFYTQRIVWFNHYKYIFNGFDFDELYDLQADPHEMRNLAQDPLYEEILEDMTKRMWRRVYQLGDYNLGNSDYGMFRFAPVGPDTEDNPFKLEGPKSR